ncbi:MAG: prolyl oligopeptidase family serine peptidase [Phycisphaerae bacterium]|nr:prolyl oligopeptidase family serine peptidase [Phycisphaerae bacterium]
MKITAACISRAILVVILSATFTCADGPAAANKPAKVFSGGPKLLVVNGYSTSFRWPGLLQRKINRLLEGKGGIEVISATRGGTPIAKWIDVKTGKPLAAWSRVTDALKRKGDRPAIVLCQQSLQWAFGRRTESIGNAEDSRRIKLGADIIEKYARAFFKDGADKVFVAMHIYKHPMEPGIGNERLALAKLMTRKIPNLHAGPDVWAPTKQVYPWGFARDTVHPGEAANEIMAQLWFETLLKHDGLKVPAWSTEEMKKAIDASRPDKPSATNEPKGRQLRQRHDKIKPACQRIAEQYEALTFEDNDTTLPYRFFKPKRGKGKKYPLVIFLHGAGGRGKDNKKQLDDQIVGPCIWALPENQAKHPCFVIAPQSGGRWAWSEKPTVVVKKLIDKTVKEFPIDTTRIYLTGLSMGGYGTWRMLADYPDFFAAAMPVCGKGDVNAAPKIAKHKTQIWAFHGARDSVVRPEGSRSMVAAIKKAGGQIKYTEYPDVGHNSWEGAYSDPKLIEWTFSQQKKR